jgi:hypothetical protein
MGSEGNPLTAEHVVPVSQGGHDGSSCRALSHLRQLSWWGNGSGFLDMRLLTPVQSDFLSPVSEGGLFSKPGALTPCLGFGEKQPERGLQAGRKT